MTEHKPIAVSNYNFTSKDKLFLDTNIWLYLYAPHSHTDKWVRIYSEMLKSILAAQSLIYIDVLVVSEFINAYARQQWRLRAPDTNFKTFRNDSDFKAVAQEIAENVKRVMRYCSRTESGFETLEIDRLLDAYADGDSDFNDQVIMELCKREGLTLITHDGDFKGRGIPILTANKHLLN